MHITKNCPETCQPSLIKFRFATNQLQSLKISFDLSAESSHPLPVQYIYVCFISSIIKLPDMEIEETKRVKN